MYGVTATRRNPDVCPPPTLIDKDLSVWTLGSYGRGRSAGIRTTSRKELEVPIQLVTDGGVVGAGGL